MCHASSLKAFLARKTQGLGLSDRVWRYTEAFKNEIELGLDLGIRSGKSAAAMTRDLRQYLQHPDKLFRRVRDEHGLLKLSQAAKEFHPGRGVYRSSYMNARRLAATETNIAYRTADHLRWQKMDFVVGIEIVLSNNHTIRLQPGEKASDLPGQMRADGTPKANAVRTLTDICDTLAGRYPKDFKFTGWHPHCRCRAVTILKTEEEMARDSQRILDGKQPSKDSANAVTDTPEAFKNWVENNRDRIASGHSLPYFVRDNAKYTGITAKQARASSTPLGIAAERHAKRTDADIKSIQDRWNAKRERDRKIKLVAENILKLKAEYPLDIDFGGLESLVATNNLTRMQKETRAVAQAIKAIRDKENSLKDFIPNIRKWHKQYSLEQLQYAHMRVQATLNYFKNYWGADYASGSKLLKLKNGLEKKIQNPASHAPAWPAEQDAYTELLGKVETRLQLVDLSAKYNSLASFKTNSKEFLEWVGNAKKALNNGDAKDAAFWLNKAGQKKQSLEAINAKKTAKAAANSNASGMTVENTAEQTAHLGKMRKDDAIETIRAQTGCSKQKAIDFYEAGHGFSYKWDWEIRQLQCGNTTFMSKHGHTLAEVRKKAEDLEEFIKHAPKWDGGTTYRGMSLSDKELQDAVAKMKAGTFHNYGTASWSTKKDISEQFAGDYVNDISKIFGDRKRNMVVLRIEKQKKATSIQHLSALPHECEVIASKDCRYKFVKMERKGGYLYITVRAL